MLHQNHIFFQITLWMFNHYDCSSMTSAKWGRQGGSSITDFCWQGGGLKGPKYTHVIIEQPITIQIHYRLLNDTHEAVKLWYELINFPPQLTSIKTTFPHLDGRPPSLTTPATPPLPPAPPSHLQPPLLHLQPTPAVREAHYCTLQPSTGGDQVARCGAELW